MTSTTPATATSIRLPCPSRLAFLLLWDSFQHLCLNVTDQRPDRPGPSLQWHLPVGEPPLCSRLWHPGQGDCSLFSESTTLTASSNLNCYICAGRVQHPQTCDHRTVQTHSSRNNQVSVDPHFLLQLFKSQFDVRMCFQVHFGHWHGETQWNPQQVQEHPAHVWLEKQGTHGSGKAFNLHTSTSSFSWTISTAVI